jgi:hypothetical protein
MTTSFKLNLPTDIQWKRKCVSDAVSWYRWRSPIAVFEYEPKEENQTYEGMRISYLKVSNTITGYQENPKEIGVDRRGTRSYWADQPGIDNYLNTLEAYYPCYGCARGGSRTGGRNPYAARRLPVLPRLRSEKARAV